MKKKLLWVASTLLVLIAVGFLLKHNLQQKRTTDGIDISHHNIVRDWNKVNVGFIYAKATEGKSHRDTKFVRFRKNAMKRNIPFGAYHFLSTDELPIPNDSLKALVGGWIQECYDYYGYYPLLYLSPYHLYLRLMGTSNLSKCQLWSGITTPHWDIIPFYTARIVQFKIDKMDGFEGGIDCNHLNGSLDDLRMKE